MPYVVYTVAQEEHRGSDDKNNILSEFYRAELYTARIDTKAEAKINEALGFTSFTKETIYIESEKLYMTAYEFEIISKN